MGRRPRGPAADRRAHAEVTALLSDHRDRLDNLTGALLAAETLDATDAYAAADVAMRTQKLETAAVAEAVRDV